MADVPQRCTPEHILYFIDCFLEYLCCCQQGNAENLRQSDNAPEGFAQFLGNFRQHVHEMAEYLKREAVLRDIPGNGLVNFQAQWGKLFRDYPDTIEALKHFRGYFPDAMLIEIVRITDPLKIKVQDELLAQQTKRPAAGAAFDAAMREDPKARAAWERARQKLQAYAKVMNAANTGSADELRRRLDDMADAIREGLRASGDELAAQGFTPPATIEDWEHLARIVEIPLETIRNGDLTAREIYACALAWADRQKIKAKLSVRANPPTSTKPRATYTVAAVLEMTGVSDTTLNRYAKLAGVNTPKRGKRNHRYTTDEVRLILQAITDNTSDRAMKERCCEALEQM